MNRGTTQEIWNTVFRSGNRLYQLIAINVFIFLLINLLNLLVTFGVLSASFYSAIFQQFQLPANFYSFIQKPWTLLTYMVTQVSVFHLLFNMLWLFWLGKIFLDFLTQRQLLQVYLMGGILGAVVFFLSYGLIPVFSAQADQHFLIGSSAGVCAVIFATATLVPTYTIRMLFFGNVQLKYLALAFIVLDILGVGGSNAGGSLAHIGGAFSGYLFIRQLRSGRKIHWPTKWFKKKSPLKVVHVKSEIDQPSNTKAKFGKAEKNIKAQKQAQIDEILDKISKSGYENLSKEEKEILFRASKED